MMVRKRFFGLVVLVMLSFLATEVGDAWARARGGGSRGSRSYSAPAKPAPAQPSSPSQFNTPSSPVAPQRPSMFRGLAGGIAGFALGGLLGSMLFGGLGHGLGGGLGGGFGMLDMLLIVGGIGLLIMYFRRRRAVQAETPAYATAGGYGGATYGGPSAQTGYSGGGGGAVTMEAPAGLSDLERGIAHIRQMDPGFDPARLIEFARSAFHGVQAAVQSRDLSLVQQWLTPQMYSELRSQSDQLTAARRTNRVERIEMRDARLTEVWQESGRDFTTVLLSASLIDYVVDDATGNVVEGSKTTPQSIEEFWTFTRPVGSNAWQLSAIQSV